MQNNYCPECSNVYKSFEHCPECNVPLQQQFTPSIGQRVSGKHNQSVQIVGGNQGDIVIQHSPSEQNETTIYRESIKPIKIGNKPVKTWWILASGLVPFATNVIALIKSVMGITHSGLLQNTYSIPIFMTIIPGALLLLSAILLYRLRYMTFFVGPTIEVDKQGLLYRTNIVGTCGICQAPVRVKTVGSHETRQTRIICTNNPDQHWWDFDRTELGDVGEDYRSRQ